MTGLEIIGALGAIIGILKPLLDAFDSNDAKEIAAICALSKAVTSTEKYTTEKQKIEAPVEANYELTNLWHQASLSFRDAGHLDMQELCSMKGDFWLDPSNWDKDTNDQAAISLKRMRERLNNVLSTI